MNKDFIVVRKRVSQNYAQNEMKLSYKMQNQIKNAALKALPIYLYTFIEEQEDEVVEIENKQLLPNLSLYTENK